MPLMLGPTEPIVRSENFLLLENVLPFFLPALKEPMAEVEDKKSFRKQADAIQDLRSELEHVSDAFTIEDSRWLAIDEKNFKEMELSLEGLLGELENVINNHNVAPIATVTNANKKSATKFRNLCQLQWDTQLADFNLAEKKESLKTLFSKDIREYRALTRKARLFNTTMRIIHKLMVGPDKMQALDLDLPDWQGPATTYTRELSAFAHYVPENLKGLMCTERNDHEGFLRLDSLNLSQIDTLRPNPSDLFMLLPSGDGDNRLWLPTVFHVTESIHGGQVLEPDSLCAEIDGAITMNIPAIAIDIPHYGVNVAIRETQTIESGSQVGRGPVKTPTLTLNDVFSHEKAVRSQPESNSRYYYLACNIKRRLAVEIATAVLYLSRHDNSEDSLSKKDLFCAEALTMDAIFMLDWNSEPLSTTETGIELFLKFSVEEQPLLGSPPKFELIAGDIAVRTPCFLALALIILQLEMDEVVVLRPTDINQRNQKESWYAAALRCNQELADRASDQIRTIIHQCLKLALKDMEQGTFEANLRYKVVIPLTVWSNSFTYKGLKRPGALLNLPVPKRVKTTHPPRAEYVPLSVDMSTWQPTFPIRSAPLAWQTDQKDLFKFGNTESLAQELENVGLSAIQDSDGWMTMIQEINDIVGDFIDASEIKDAEAIRVAILDTGCDIDVPTKGIDAASRLKNRWHDLAGNAQDPVDEDKNKHGSAVTAIFLDTAHHVEAYVIRVAKDPASLESSNVAKAIAHATGDWDVHIISLSFGFTSIKAEVAKAIREANVARERIFLAAVGNEGANEPERFPASHPAVISVGGTDHRGKFEYMPQRSESRTSELYGTLAIVFSIDQVRKGSSYATPILAGILATLMQYACYLGSKDLQKALERKDFIDELLRQISTPTWGNKFLRYVEPWTFFKKSKEARALMLLNAWQSLPAMD